MARPEDRIALIELVERDGRVRRVVDVERWPLTIGRAIDNDLVIDDPHVAPHHLSIDIDPLQSARMKLTVGDTRNGVLVGPRTLMQGESAPLPPHGEPWQIGATRLRVRMPADLLDAERPMGLAVTGARPWVTLVCALLVWALVLVEHGIDLDPGSSLTDWLAPLIGVPVVVALWCVVWGVGSKVFQHRFEFWAHFAVLAKGLLLIGVLDLVLPLVAFSLSWEWLSRISASVAALVAAGVLYRHAALVVPLSRRLVAGAIGACVLLAGVVLGTLEHQRSDRIFTEQYLASLPPPALRLAAGVSPHQFLADAARLRAKLDKRAAVDDSHDDEDDD